MDSFNHTKALVKGGGSCSVKVFVCSGKDIDYIGGDQRSTRVMDIPSTRVSLNKAIRPDIDQLSNQSVRPELTVPSDDTSGRQKE